MINDTAVPQRAVLASDSGRIAQCAADENINCALDRIGIVTTFLFQKAFLDERIDFCFV